MKRSLSPLRLIIPAIIALVGGCAPVAEVPPPGDQSLAPAAAGHPLVGRIWAPEWLRFAEPEAVLLEALQARFVLLGEKHGNPDHHRLQEETLRILIAAGRRPALAFEMIPVDRQAALDAARWDGNPASIGPAVRWQQRGWPDWAMYQPIAAAALEAGLPIVAADLARDRLLAVRRDGLAALGPSLVGEMLLADPLPPSMMEAVAAEMERSHCGRISGAAAARMANVQIARDAFMAHRLIEAARTAPTRSAVLVAGHGHAAKDHGVPFHLARQAPGEAVVAIAFLEVRPGESEPESYAAVLGRQMLPFDFVWFTPRLGPDDPGAAHKEKRDPMELVPRC
jgi:uncharacterized iron-regulated protein